MAEILYILFYAGVLTLIFGCVVYLAISRSEAPSQEPDVPERVAMPHPESHLDRHVLADAEAISGAYHLRDLERILIRLASLQAWGLIVDLGFPTIGDLAQIILHREDVDLYSHHAGQIPGYLERFRQSAERAGLKLHPVLDVEEDFFVRIPGPWSERAAMLRRLLGEIYGVDETAEMKVQIFR